MTTRQAGGVALVLVVLSMFLMTVFQTIELVEERRNLGELHDLQDNSIREAAVVRHRLEALGNGVVQLAGSGDAGAQAVIDQMRRQGLNLAARKP